MSIDVSVLIVHHSTPRLLRQTLKGIRRAAPRVAFETIVVDNNPFIPIASFVEQEFPEVRVLVTGKNIGFGQAMNKAMDAARGTFFFIFNPDIVLARGALEQLLVFMEKEPQVGIVAPRLLNPDGSLQYSCYRFLGPETILCRRAPFISKSAWAQKKIDYYLMKEWDHASIRDVDYALGAALFARKDAVQQVGGFDPRFFVYFEDQDWCRRFWKNGWRVVYHPEVALIHYHRRETAEGHFFKQLFNPLSLIQLKSAWKYYQKYRGEFHPREHMRDLSQK